MKIKDFFIQVISYIKGYSVILDDRDNSVTLSPSLYKEIDKLIKDKNEVFVFRDGDTFGFCVNNPQIAEAETQKAILQYNTHFKTYGFESLNPTVNRMYYEFNLPIERRYRLTVTRRKVKGTVYYRIERPTIIRKYDTGNPAEGNNGSSV